MLTQILISNLVIAFCIAVFASVQKTRGVKLFMWGISLGASLSVLSTVVIMFLF